MRWVDVPPERVRRVRRARQAAANSGFALSSDDGVGRLLAALAAAVPPGGRILELGTGCGVGTAWIVGGLGGRRDVEIVTVEANPETVALARRQEWPPFVRFVTGDGRRTAEAEGVFDLVFADCPSGKHEGLDSTISCLAPGGVLVVDDLTPVPEWPDDLGPKQEAVRRTLLEHADLQSVELGWSSGVIISVRRRSGHRVV
jgi:demethylmenaquinone methyltransferase/2-methoxy-6-polyprenyl-1,4-benzoquinol methylase